jgi:signal transduction histidine kinase
VAAVAFMATVTFYAAQQFSRRAADTRASGEAISFAEHSGTLATGDAFDGYIEMLRYADDPAVHSKASTREARVGAMQQLLYLNVNNFSSLTIADRSGLVLATTDPSIVTVGDSPTFAETRANLSPANSDIVLSEPGKPGYIEYTAPLKDADGTTWGVIIGRADPARIWKGTLAAAVDGSRNVIINSDGLFAAGVPDELLGQPWRGAPVGNGGVSATIAGVNSICGLAPIGKDTQIDRGLNVASCLPTSVIEAEHGHAMGKQGLVTLAAAVLSVVLGGGVLLLFGRSSGPEARVRPAKALAADVAEARVASLAAVIAAPEPEALAAPEARPNEPVVAEEQAAPEAEAAPEEEPAEAQEEAQQEELDEALDDEAADEPEADMTVAVAPTDEAVGPPEPEAPGETTTERLSEPAPPLAVDALTLIEAYEQRNARLSERLRESVQAKLLVASAQADEAYKLAQAEAEEDKEVAHKLHAHVMEELGRLQEHELRAISQELHPALIRMGLPGALRSLAKEFTDVVAITLDVDPAADSVGRTAGRAAIPTGQRLTLYRFATEAVRALAGAGAPACTLTLRREDGVLVLHVSGATSAVDGAPVDRNAFAASGLAAEAYGGFVTVSHRDEEATLAMELPAQPAEEMPEVDLAAFEAEATEEAEGEGLESDAVDQLEPEEAVSATPSVTVFTLAPDAADEIDEAAEPDQESAESADSEDDEDAMALPNVKVFTLDPEAGDEASEHEQDAEEATPPHASPDADLTGALEKLRDESADFLAIALDIDLSQGQEAIDVPQRKTTVELARAVVEALRQAHAQRCSMSVKHGSDMLMVSIISETDGTPFDAAPIQPVEAAVEALGGYVAVSRRDNNVSVTAEIMAPAISTGSTPESSSDAAA